MGSQAFQKISLKDLPLLLPHSLPILCLLGNAIHGQPLHDRLLLCIVRLSLLTRYLETDLEQQILDFLDFFKHFLVFIEAFKEFRIVLELLLALPPHGGQLLITFDQHFLDHWKLRALIEKRELPNEGIIYSSWLCR